MTPHPRLSEAGIELVKRFEGLRRKAARLETGGWTIGYGHTASAREGAEVTAEQAELLLTYDLDRVARAIDPLIFSPLNANQFNALVAFAFNVGVENFRGSAVLKRVNEGNQLQAAAAIELWRRAPFEGERLVVDGLVRRRAAEKLLFLTPSDGFRPIPTPVVRPAHDDGDPPGHGLAGVVELEAPLEGDQAVARRSEVERAADNFTARLQQLFPEEAAPAPEPQPEPAPEPEPVVAEEPPPPPHLSEPAARHVYESDEMAVEAPAPEPPIAKFGRRQAVEAAGPPPLVRSPYAVFIVGVVGALMFVGALAAMIYGRATLANLVVGVVGVVAMAPAALRLLLLAFDEKPPASR